MSLREIEIFASLDWGWNAPGCVLFWLCLTDGHYHIIDEIKFQRKNAFELGDHVKRRVQDLGLGRLRYIAADPAIWQHTGAGKGEAIAETLACRPISLPMKKSDNDRLNGWARVHELLGPAPDGQPWLTIDERCTYLRRTIPAAVSDKTDADDVDCWVAGTLVATPRGPVPIEQVRPGDVVETPVGPRPVTHAYLSGTSETAWVECADGRRLEGTPRHKIYVRGKGLVPLGNIECDDILQPKITWSRLLNIAVWCIAGTQAVSTTRQAVQRFVKARRASIGRCGWMPVARFQTAGMSITSMATMTTTSSTISTVSLRASMDASTLLRVSRVTLDNGSRHGVAQSLDAPRSETTRGKCSRGRLNGNARAAIVAVLSARDTRRNSFAPMCAPSAGDTWRSRWCARCAASLSKLVARRTDKSKPVRIVAVGRCADKKPVYNLTVADARLFYAHGILSSNTTIDDHGLDALRYGAMSRPSPTRKALEESMRPSMAGYLLRQAIDAARPEWAR